MSECLIRPEQWLSQIDRHHQSPRSPGLSEMRRSIDNRPRRLMNQINDHRSGRSSPAGSAPQADSAPTVKTRLNTPVSLPIQSSSLGICAHLELALHLTTCLVTANLKTLLARFSSSCDMPRLPREAANSSFMASPQKASSRALIQACLS